MSNYGKKLIFIIKLYNRNHSNKWNDLSEEEKEWYYNRNIRRYGGNK